MNILQLKVGPKRRKLLIKDIKTSKVINKQEQLCDKVVFITYDEATKNSFNISDCWLKDRQENNRIQGLWLSLSESDKLNPSSAIAKLLKYYNVNSLQDFIGKEVYAFPDHNDYLVLLGCDL